MVEMCENCENFCTQRANNDEKFVARQFFFIGKSITTTVTSFREITGVERFKKTKYFRKPYLSLVNLQKRGKFVITLKKSLVLLAVMVWKYIKLYLWPKYHKSWISRRWCVTDALWGGRHQRSSEHYAINFVQPKSFALFIYRVSGNKLWFQFFWPKNICETTESDKLINETSSQT